MTFAIEGLGTALPECSLSQERAAALTSLVSGHTEDQARRLAVLYRHTGIHKRHVTLLDRSGTPPVVLEANGPSTDWRMRRYDEQARPLAREASRRALADAGDSSRELTHLVTISCTGFAAPGFDLALIKDLDLRPSVTRTHLGFMGCHGALNGLRVAQAFVGSDRSARVLLCAVELCSLHFQYGWQADLAVANALFADGAAAVVGARGSDDRPEAWRLLANGSCLLPDTEDAMSWHIGDHGFLMTLSPNVSPLIKEHLRGWLESWLDSYRLTLAQVGCWAVHPGGPRILDAVEEALGLDRCALADARAVLADYGNMSSPTVLFILDRLRQRRAPRPCVALAFGPGLAIEAAVFI
jgi:predicted naringenin-chalcone synthase